MAHQPIKRNPHLIPISKEHHGTLLFCWKLKQGLAKNIDSSRIIKYIHWYWQNHIIPHFETEEKYLFVNEGDKMVLQALQEHQSIKESILSLDNMDEVEIRHTIEKISQLVNDHTRYEERELFPYLEETLSELELEAIGKALQKEEHTADEDYNDEFWTVKP
ncbi:MAG: hemerythrin domain-containing protein [Niabella sp.]